MVLGIIGLSFGIYNKVSAQEAPDNKPDPAAGDTAAPDSATNPAPQPAPADTAEPDSTTGPAPTPTITSGDRPLLQDNTSLGSRDHTGPLPESPPVTDPPVSERVEETRPGEAVVVLDEESDETKPSEAAIVLEESADETKPGEVVLGEETEETKPNEAVIVRNDEQQEETKPNEVVVAPQPAQPRANNGATALPEEPTVVRPRTRPSLVREYIPGGTDADVRFIPNGELQVREYTGNKTQVDDAVVLTNEK